MTGWHEGVLFSFDTETTGTDPETARIVTATFMRRGGGSEPFDRRWLIDPQVEIPAEASAIHGITTEQARADGMDARVALDEITAALWGAFTAGLPLVIYNAPYDLTVMDRETRRHGLEPLGDALLTSDALVIDPFVLDKHVDPYRRGKRTLTAACEHYGVKLDGAHDSTADALGAMRVAWKLAVRYPEIAAMEPGDLCDLQVRAKAEQAASFQDYLRRQGSDEVIDGSWPLVPLAEVAA